MKKLLLVLFALFFGAQFTVADTKDASADTVVFYNGVDNIWFEWYDFWGGSLPVVGSDTCKYAYPESYEVGKNSLKWVMDNNDNGFAWAWWSGWNKFDYRDIFTGGYLNIWIRVPATVDTIILEFKTDNTKRLQYYLMPTTATFDDAWHNYKIPFANWVTPPAGYTLPIDSTNVTLFGIFTNVGEKNSVVYLGYAAAMPYDPSIPVELTSFTAKQVGSIVNLFWSTATETNNKGYEIERKINDNNWQVIGFEKGKGTTSEKSEYSFIDKINYSGKVYYRLKQIDFDGSFSYSNEAVINIAAPSEFKLEQNYPNPFNPATTINYQLGSDVMVNIALYNALGQQVRVLVNEYKTAGTYEVKLNASDLTSGIYYYKMTAGNFSSSQKMILMK
ncbi:MAG: T9SS type A sorting domain-containing protein [Ignavibacteriaceae bacterium]|nr:T9SS type A sorting domain-containing protein [Ignavibacteriaceae bacterium]